MTSYLIDVLLVVALVVTALRCGRMHKELRALRQTDLAEALVDAEVSLNRAAEAIVAARHEGVDTVRQLERQLVEARRVTAELSGLVGRGEASPAAEAGVDPYRDFFAAAQDRLHASLAR
ncbi:hypothetical protein [Jiella avicenniae]|uniref:Uncharacterized protein n=1 Tax=Jiella avicenniae TaxID=2907202 RepID=A0A9X1NXF5_9HYPH|nr:hypothetical protein [Jiella avicenniae]MCE7026693.1 hypothetical protein [Jiella avicenniae]